MSQPRRSATSIRVGPGFDLAAPLAGDLHRGVGRPPRERAVIIGVAVEPEVQSRARADFANRQRQAGAGRDPEISRQQRGRSGDLVGLRRAVEKARQPLVEIANRNFSAAPVLLFARQRMGRIQRRERGMSSAGEKVQRAASAQRDRVGLRLAGPVQQSRCESRAFRQPLVQHLADERSERRAQARAPFGLAGQVLASREIHAASCRST